VIPGGFPRGRFLLGLTLVALGSALAPGVAGAATISSSTPTPLADNFSDDGECSLREMVQIANTDSAAVENACTVDGALGADTIELGSGTYQLGPDNSFDEDGTPDDNAQGDLDINENDDQSLTIDGQGAAGTAINSSLIMPAVRPLDLISGSPATIQELMVMGGHITGAGANGGGIRTGSAALTLTRASVSTNSAVDGGGVYATGPTSVVDSAITGNNASDDGGGIRAFGPLSISGTSAISGNGAGGGIVDDGGGIAANTFGTGGLVISGALTMASNVAGGTGGAISIFSTDLGPTISGATLTDNDAGGIGGGIFFESIANDQLSISGTTISDGSAESGGGLYLQAPAAISTSTIFDNTAGEAVDDGIPQVGGGAGVYIGQAGAVSFTDSTISGNDIISASANDSVSGGGIFSQGGNATPDTDLTLRRTTVSGNTVAGGGSRSGAGVIGFGTGFTRLENSTIAVNSISGAGDGGGLFGSPGGAAMAVVQSTISANFSTNAPGILGNGPVTLRGSIVRQGAAGCGGGGTFTANAFNLDQGTSCVGAVDDTDLEGVDALVGPLQANGGPTATMLPAAGSPAVDAVPAASCTDLSGGALAVDQRGLPRPDDGNGNGAFDCEAGAAELQVSGPRPGAPPATCAGKQATIVGTDAAEKLKGTSGPDVIAALAGKDVVKGLGGKDLICGGAGKDRLLGGGGKDRLLGQAGRDVLRGGGARDVLKGGPGRDTQVQ
jgi:hypothetical protein